jgi:glycosyltransferase involved in cell wall biosynthesis
VKLAIVTDLLAPYRIPLFNLLGEALGSGFRAFLMARTAPNRPWNELDQHVRFEWSVLRGEEVAPGGSRGFNQFWNPGIVAALHRFDPDIIVIGGFHHPTSFAALLYGRTRNRKVVLWSESTPFDMRPSSAIRDYLKRWFVARCDAFLVPGTAARSYIVSLGADPSAVFTAPNAIDVASFEHAAEETALTPRSRREALPPFCVLFVGRLSPEKGLPMLIEAIASLQLQGRRLGLVAVGEGDSAEDYIRKAEDDLAVDSVLFTGQLKPAELAAWYRAADVLVLPSSSEPWGFVVNEAMAFGLPVICSSRVGAAYDLIIDGETGFVCESENDYARAIARLMDSPAERERIAEAASTVIRSFTPEAAADGFAEMVRFLGFDIPGHP